MNVARRVAYATAVQIAGRGVLTAIGIVSFAIVVRYLGVDGFGSYSLILSFVPILVALADFGLTTIGVREIARQPERRTEILGTILTLRLLSASAVSAAFVLLAPLLPYPAEVTRGLQLAVVGLFLLLLATVPTVVFQSSLRMDLQVVVDLVMGGGGLVLILAVVRADLGFMPLVGAWVGATVLGCALAYVLAFRLARLRPALDRALARVLVRAAIPLGLVMAMSIVHFKVDAILLSLMKPIGDVGIYNGAYKLLEQTLVLPALFIAAVFPVLASYVAFSSPALVATVQKSFTFLLMLGAPIAVGSFVLAEPIIDLVAGDEFADSVLPLRILVWAVLFSFVNALFANLLVIYDRQLDILAISTAAVVLNIGLNLVLIPPFSYVGASVATIVTEAGGALAIGAWALRKGGLRVDGSPIPRVALASLAMGGLMYATAGLPLAVPVAVGLVSYAVLVYALRVVTRRDLAIVFKESAGGPDAPPPPAQI